MCIIWHLQHVCTDLSRSTTPFGITYRRTRSVCWLLLGISPVGHPIPRFATNEVVQQPLRNSKHMAKDEDPLKRFVVLSDANFVLRGLYQIPFALDCSWLTSFTLSLTVRWQSSPMVMRSGVSYHCCTLLGGKTPNPVMRKLGQCSIATTTHNCSQATIPGDSSFLSHCSWLTRSASSQMCQLVPRNLRWALRARSSE